MIVKIPVSFQTRVHSAVTGLDWDSVQIVDMWIDAADLATVKNPTEILTRHKPSDYKFDVTAVDVFSDKRFRLKGCWSPRPGELLADKAVPVEEKEE